MLMRYFLIAALVWLLTGCLPGNRSALEIGEHDLYPHLATVAPTVPIDMVMVEAASWLTDTKIGYRLIYAEASRRRAYAHSRWAAPPAELIQRALLRRWMMTEPVATTGQSQPRRHGACRLRIDLEEFAQKFASPTMSEFHLDARVALLPARGEQPLEQRAFALRTPAMSADAAGGVAAARQATQELAASIESWLDRQREAWQEICLGGAR